MNHIYPKIGSNYTTLALLRLFFLMSLEDLLLPLVDVSLLSGVPLLLDGEELELLGNVYLSTIFQSISNGELPSANYS